VRILSGVFIVVSYIIARFEMSVIVTLMSLSWGAVAGSFMAPFLLGLYWKRTTAAGVYAGIVAALALEIGLFLYIGEAKAPLIACIAMIVLFIVVPAVSVLTRPPSGELLEKAFRKNPVI
jgi:SSS family solute:Na+ symporter